MDTVKIIDASGDEVHVPESNFQRAIINYLRQVSPDRVKIIAEMKNYDGFPRPVPAAICFLAKNPENVAHYTDVIPLEEK